MRSMVRAIRRLLGRDKPQVRTLDIGEHESTVRWISHEEEGIPYVAFVSLEEAQADAQGVVVLEGDYGGQIYVVVPAARVSCSQEALQLLLEDLDEIAWAANPPEARHVYFERHAIGDGIWGGMGGALVADGVWIHEEFAGRGLRLAIEGVLAGRRARLEE